MKPGDQVALIENNQISAYGFVVRAAGNDVVCRFWTDPPEIFVSEETLCRARYLKRYDLYMQAKVHRVMLGLGYELPEYVS